MNTPSPACGKVQSHKRKKLLRSDEILGKRKKAIRQENGSLALETSTLAGANVVPSEVTPDSSNTQKRSGANRLTDRTHNSRRKKGIILDDARILGFLREPFTSVMKSSGKTPIDAKGLKRVANSNFSLIFNQGTKVTSRRDRTTLIAPIIVTQSQSEQLDIPFALTTPDLPMTVASHGTVESMALRRYLLEDIMMARVGEELVLLVSLQHPWFSSYKSIAEKSSPMPLATIGAKTFIQVKASVTVNCQYDNLEHGNMLQKDIEGLLFGNGNGAVILHFLESHQTLQVLWKEFFDNVDTIQVWGSRPMKRRLYDALHNLTSLEA